MNTLKGALLSKTVWFNVIMLAIGVITILSKNHSIDPKILADITGIGNLILRLVTTGSLADKVN